MHFTGSMSWSWIGPCIIQCWRWSVPGVPAASTRSPLTFPSFQSPAILLSPLWKMRSVFVYYHFREFFPHFWPEIYDFAHIIWSKWDFLCSLGGYEFPPAVHYCRRIATDIRDLVQLTGILQNTHSSWIKSLTEKLPEAPLALKGWLNLSEKNQYVIYFASIKYNRYMELKY